MKVLFIFPIPSSKYIFVDFQNGIASISAILKQKQHETSLWVRDALKPPEITDKIEKFQPGLVGFSNTSDQSVLAEKMINFIYDRFHLPIIAGGPHPTVCPEETIGIRGVKFLCVGEGEYPMLELVKALEKNEDYRHIQNLWIDQGNEIIKNEVRPLIQNLESLPFPDRDLFDYQKLLDIDHRADFMAGRGCPYPCSYCINHKVIDTYRGKGKYVRLRKVKNVIEEIQQVLSKYQRVESIHFHDDTFIINKTWVKEFCAEYKKHINMPLLINARADLIDEEIIEWLKMAGCVEIKIGVEHGNEKIRNSIMKRNMSNEQIINAFQIIKKAGIKAWAYNMMGLPEETKETIWDTINLNREIKPDKLFISIFYPYKGTTLYEYCKEKGMLTDQTVNTYFEPISTLQLPTIKKKEVEYYFRIFRIAVMYPKMLWLGKILAKAKIWKNTTLYDVAYLFLYRSFIFIRKNFPPALKEKIFKILRI